MKNSVSLTVISLFILVTVVYFYFNPLDEKKSSTNSLPSAPEQVLEVQKGDPVVWIQIENMEKKETLTMERQEGKWMLIDPVAYPADQMIVEGLVTALRLSTKARSLLPEKGWEEYGLKDPSIKIRIKTKNDPSPRTLYFGDLSPVGNFVFARWEGKNEYFLANSDLKKAFESSVYSVRQKQLFRIPLNEISKIRIHTFSADYEITKQGEKWYWMEPIPMLGNELSKSKIDEIYNGLSDLHIKEFVDHEKTYQGNPDFGSGPSVKLWGKDNKVEVLSVGEEVPVQDGYYARREGEKDIFLIAKENILKFFQNVEAIAQQPAVAGAAS